MKRFTTILGISVLSLCHEAWSINFSITPAFVVYDCDQDKKNLSEWLLIRQWTAYYFFTIKQMIASFFELTPYPDSLMHVDSPHVHHWTGLNVNQYQKRRLDRDPYVWLAIECLNSSEEIYCRPASIVSIRLCAQVPSMERSNNCWRSGNQCVFVSIVRIYIKISSMTVLKYSQKELKPQCHRKQNWSSPMHLDTLAEWEKDSR